MTSTTMTSREFNQDASGAKKAARQGPVFITDRGRPIENGSFKPIEARHSRALAVP